ncbi:hypothetical protein DL768_006075 [Monosporascus sp. mg162]|nr:hypothetical protein DL768_006075 [Monosporascus sp. mg162]
MWALVTLATTSLLTRLASATGRTLDSATGRTLEIGWSTTGDVGQGYYETLDIHWKYEILPPINTSISYVTERFVNLPSGSNYTNPVGTLGLGRDLDGDPWILEQLKSAGNIASNTFSLHMGSALLEQPGSLVLGGYEKNRALGQAGTFPLRDGRPTVILMDVFLGTEVGPSAFGKNGSISIYQGLGNDTSAAYLSKWYGTTQGAAIAVPNPSSPYMYLPISDTMGTCEAAAKNLPVTWDAALGLGLAFLQATFMFVDFETNRTIIAQAPGPDMAQSVLRVVEAGNQDVIETNPIDTWAESWASTWEVLSEFDSSNEGIKEQASKTSLHIGAKAGICVGSAVAAIAILAISSFCWWKRKQAPRPASGGHDKRTNGGATGYSGPQELPPDEVPAEIGNGLPHELEAAQQT